MIIWNFNSPVTLLACVIWNFCEYFKLDLGCVAPYVFVYVTNCNGESQ